MWGQLKLILWKNLIIRKRHWFLTLIEVLIPITLFTLVAYGRSKITGLNKIYINESTNYDPIDLLDIYHQLDREDLKLWYSPSNEFTEAIMTKVQNKLQIRGEAVQEFSSKDQLLSYFNNNSSSLITAINFNENNPFQLNYDLTIHDKYLTWKTDKLYVPNINFEDERSSLYLYKGFAALQVAIDLSFMELYSNNINVDFNLQQFPDPPRTVDSGINQLFMFFLPLITIFSFLFLCPAVLQRVGEEKISGTKEYMKMVGLKSWIIWLGWFIHALTTNFFSIIVIVILMKVPLWDVSYPPIEHTDGTVLFLFLFLYCMAAITFCFLIATVFKNPSIATVFGILIWLISYFLPQAWISSREFLPWKCKIPFGVLPNMALYFGYSSISVYETRDSGIHWKNLFAPGTGDDSDVSMGNVFVVLIVDTVLFMLLTVYIENVKPGKYGIAKSYGFPLIELKRLLKCLWFHRVSHLPTPDEETGIFPEEQPIKLYNVFKKYSKTVAVDNLSMEIKKNQITVLLGQNGAGKTTTMSILTGMINASSGCVLVNGLDMQKHTDEARKVMGLCPQHNLLFPDLSVFEHLLFFAMLKGSDCPNDDAMCMLKELGIDEKKNSMANILSGGMKRKLCLGMALIGKSEILILDEPTSGIDPESRRKVWDLLLKKRKKKTILITTHFMEEADVLADQIAIMANGRLQCYGTPFELKKEYNTGYHLCLLLESKQFLDKITESVRKYFDEAKIIRQTDDSVIYSLPLVKGGCYRDVLELLENEQNNLKIKKISVSITTLNDVFLKAKDVIDGPEKNQIDGKTWQKYTKPEKRSNSNKFFALMKKRVYFLKKKYYWFVSPTLVSITLFLLAIWISLSSSDHNSDDGPPLNFTLARYSNTKVYYGGLPSSDPVINKIRKTYSEIVLQENGLPKFKEDVSKGIIQEGIDNIAFYKKHLITAAEFNVNSKDGIIVNAMFSSNALHGIPISVNLAMNSIIKTYLNDSFSIFTSNTPLKKFKYTQSSPSELSEVSVASVWLLLIPIGIFFFSSNFIMFPHTEISTNFLQIQINTGLQTYMYWFTNWVFDVLFSVIPIAILFLSLVLINALAYNSGAFQSKDICAIFVIVVTYILTTIPYTYLISYRKSITSGFATLLMLGIFTGIVPTIIILGMEASGNSNDKRFAKIAECLKPILIVVFPQFGLSYTSVLFSKKFVENYNWRLMDPDKRKHLCAYEPNPCCSTSASACENYKSYFANEKLGIQIDLILLSVTFVLYFIVLLLLHTIVFKKLVHFFKYFTFKCLFNKNTEYSENLVEGNTGREEIQDRSLKVQNLSKSFGVHKAVKNLTFNLKKTKCFGLLGVNGAGKTTTFRMLTKYLFSDNGHVELNDTDKSIPLAKPEYDEKIGYCPQEDCLNFVLTGRQLLNIMAQLKGYTTEGSQEICEVLLKQFDLTAYADKPCSQYSGGNKRKLCTCIAFLGMPLLILLDEPTSGVDPASRRKFWDILLYLKNESNTSFLLCSHSMEECENLCDEVAIMKDGTIKDIGSLLALKNKYQNGFKVTIKLRSEKTKSEEVKNQILNRLNDTTLIEEYGETLTFQVRQNYRLSFLFGQLEDIKDQFNEDIEDYLVDQVSLEDIFLTVAEHKSQVELVDCNSIS